MKRLFRIFSAAVTILLLTNLYGCGGGGGGGGGESSTAVYVPQKGLLKVSLAWPAKNSAAPMKVAPDEVCKFIYINLFAVNGSQIATGGGALFEYAAHEGTVEATPGDYYLGALGMDENKQTVFCGVLGDVKVEPNKVNRTDPVPMEEGTAPSPERIAQIGLPPVSEDWNWSYNPEAPAGFTPLTPVIETQPASGISVTASGFTAEISFTCPAVSGTSVLVRKKGSPSSGYYDGLLIDRSTFSSSQQRTFKDGSIPESGVFYYTVFIYADNRYSSGVSASIPFQRPEILPPSGLTLNNPYLLSVEGSFTIPATADYAILLRKPGSASAAAADGTLISSYQYQTGSVHNEIFSDQTVPSPGTYFYTVFAYREGRASQGASASIQLTSSSVPPAVSLTASKNFTSVSLTAQMPQISGDYLIIKKADSAPASSTDGTSISSGSFTSGSTVTASDTIMSPGDWYYGIYVIAGGTYSNIVATSVSYAASPNVSSVAAFPWDLSNNDLYFTVPAENVSVTVVRRNDRAPSGPADGQAIYQGNPASGQKFHLADSSVTASERTLCYYAIYCHNGNFFSSGEVVAVRVQTIHPTERWTDIGGTDGNSQTAVSDRIRVFDSDGILCGKAEITTQSGYFNIIHCYMDDQYNTLAFDEGGEANESMRIFINEKQAVSSPAAIWLSSYNEQLITLTIQ